MLLLTESKTEVMHYGIEDAETRPCARRRPGKKPALWKARRTTARTLRVGDGGGRGRRRRLQRGSVVQKAKMRKAELDEVVCTRGDAKTA